MIVCRYWLQNRCTRNACPFAHTLSPPHAVPASYMSADMIPAGTNYTSVSAPYSHAPPVTLDLQSHHRHHAFTGPAATVKQPADHTSSCAESDHHQPELAGCLACIGPARSDLIYKAQHDRVEATPTILAQAGATTSPPAPIVRRKLKRPATWAPPADTNVIATDAADAVEANAAGSVPCPATAAVPHSTDGNHGRHMPTFPDQSLINAEHDVHVALAYGGAPGAAAGSATPSLMSGPDTRSTHTPSTMPHNCSSGSAKTIQYDRPQHQPSQLLAPATGHQLISHSQTAAAIRGIALPLSSDVFFTVGDDATLRAWGMNPPPANSAAGQQQQAAGLGRPNLTCYDQLCFPQTPSCLFNSFADPDWLFVGLAQEVRIINIRTHTQHSLPVHSPVLSISSMGALLLAGLENGKILVWSFDASSFSFLPTACLDSTDHTSSLCSSHIDGADEDADWQHNTSTSAVVSLEPEPTGSTSTVYAGLANGTIQVWNIASGHCRQALRGAHRAAVTQLLACDHLSALVSVSKDGAIKLWKTSASDHQQLLLQFTLVNSTEEGPIIKAASAADGAGQMGAKHENNIALPLAVCGVVDSSTNVPLLFVAYDNSQVQILELPSFQCIGTIATNNPIRAMDAGPSHSLLLGSLTGELSVWKWNEATLKLLTKVTEP